MAMHKVTTRTGDGGQTRLGDGSRVSKSCLRIEACGTVDELSSVLGVAASAGLDPRLAPWVDAVQNDLFLVGADLGMPATGQKEGPALGIDDSRVERLDAQMEELLEALSPLGAFLLPGGAPGAAGLHLARCVCRRAERLVVALSERELVAPVVIRYLNRLSDWLFVVARYENRAKGAPEPLWKKPSP